MIMGKAYLDYAPKLVKKKKNIPTLIFKTRNPDKVSQGIQVLRLQSRLRQQPGFHQDLGPARLSGLGPRAWSGQIGE
jgi:hypothetical protein